MQIDIKLAFPLIVNNENITHITLERAPTARDLGDYSAEDFFITQKPEVIAYVTSKIAKPFIPTSAILAGNAANIITIAQGLSAFLADVASKAEINIRNVSSDKASS